MSGTTGTRTTRRATKSLAITPASPGTLTETAAGAGASCAFTVATSGVANVIWVVVRKDWTWRTQPVTVATRGKVTINPVFRETGDFLKAFNAADNTLAVDSDPVTVVPYAAPAPAPAPVPDPAPAPAPAPAPPPAPAPAPADDAAFAAAWLRGLTMGVNVERNQCIDNGWVTDAFLSGLKGQGCTHLRLFPASGGQFPLMSVDALGSRHFAAVERAVGQGFKVHLDLLDVCFDNQLGDDVARYVEDCARAIAARGWNPEKVAVGAANEYGGGSNTGFQARREHLIGLLRKHLPGFVLVNAAANWGNPWTLIDASMNVMADKRMLYQWHLYHERAGELAVTEDIQAHVGAWAKGKGVSAFCGEWGIGPPDNSNGAAERYEAFPTHIDAAARGMGPMRPCMWTVTGGNWWRLNQSGSASLRTEVADAFKKADAHMRGQGWFTA